MRTSLALLASVAALHAGTGVASAQTDVTLEIGASQIGPAIGFDAAQQDAHFLIGGVRTSVYGADGSGLFVSVLGGSVLGDGTGANFLSGMLAATLQDPWSPSWSGSMDVKLFGFGVQDPFPYRTLAAEFAPGVRFRTQHTQLRVSLLGGLGRSRVEIFRPLLGEWVTRNDELWRMGTAAEYLVGGSTVQVGLAGSAHHTSGDTYRSLGGRFIVGGNWGVIELRADRWDTPLGFETTGGLAMSIPLGRWSFRGFVGRSDPDPLTLAQPGSGSGGALLGLTVYSTGTSARTRAALYEVIEYSDATSRVRLAVEPPADATMVQVLGDFTLWEPVAMRRDGDRWIVEIDVPVGTHHFGFLVDDEWYVPDDAPDVVPDEWGRLSATLVIEGAG